MILPEVAFKIKRESHLLKRIKRLFAKNKPVPKWIECWLVLFTAWVKFIILL